ncbi:MAG TPA: LpxI family protein, partial [Candidatus Eisenbacteria bacterium]|nr:LpxI family protein [Candidatus Eisenbacteria bacterium]
RRKPDEEEQRDIEYGRKIAAVLSGHDIGQSVAIAERACVAVEAMEGTDATITRAGQLLQARDDETSTLRRHLTVVKVAKPNQDMRFDVPVIGIKTIEVMQNAGASCLAIDAGRCLLLDGDAILEAANEAEITLVSG